MEISMVRFYGNVGWKFGQKISMEWKLIKTYINIQKKLEEMITTSNNIHIEVVLLKKAIYVKYNLWHLVIM